MQKVALCLLLTCLLYPLFKVPWPILSVFQQNRVSECVKVGPFYHKSVLDRVRLNWLAQWKNSGVETRLQMVIVPWYAVVLLPIRDMIERDAILDWLAQRNLKPLNIDQLSDVSGVNISKDVVLGAYFDRNEAFKMKRWLQAELGVRTFILSKTKKNAQYWLFLVVNEAGVWSWLKTLKLPLGVKWLRISCD